MNFLGARIRLKTFGYIIYGIHKIEEKNPKTILVKQKKTENKKKFP